METRTRLLAQLADGEIHSGAQLGTRLGITRAAVAKAVQTLCRSGLRIRAFPGRGYRLQYPIELLDVRRLRRELRAQGLNVGRRLTVLTEVDSTSRHLVQQLELNPTAGQICLVEWQRAGRGRRGRAWVASPFSSLLLSMSWQLGTGPGLLTGLSLAAGVAVVRALRRYGVNGVGLKWPNDILWNHRKLAGLLLDVRGEATGPCWVVLGVGINGRLATTDAKQIDQPWVDLYTITGQSVRRNDLAVAVILELHTMFERFEREGFAVYRDYWRRYDVFRDQPVRVVGDQQTIEGIARGITESGALRMTDGQGREHCFYSGDVSLRART